MNPHSTGESWQKPKTLDEWTTIASTKLDILAKIVHHHLNKDNASPLSILEDGQTLHSDTPAMVQEPDLAECDRIVIFSAFPSSNAAIRDVNSCSSTVTFCQLDSPHPSRCWLYMA